MSAKAGCVGASLAPPACIDGLFRVPAVHIVRLREIRWVRSTIMSCRLRDAVNARDRGNAELQ